jgi:hypothetical protein
MRRLYLWFCLTALGCAETGQEYCITSPSAPFACYSTAAERDTRRAELERARVDLVAAGARADEIERAARRSELDEEARKAAAEREAAEVTAGERRLAQQAELAEREARTARAQGRLNDPAYAGPALSALLCERERDLAELRVTEVRESRIEYDSGVRSLAARRAIVVEREKYEGEAFAYRKGLARIGAKRAPCAAVQPAIECFLRSRCETPAARDTADVMQYAPAHYGVELR